MADSKFTHTVEDWLAEYHPELENEIPLEPGMVFWRTTSVVGEGDGFHLLYLGGGRTSSLTGGASTHSSDSSIRNEIETGLLKPVAVEDLPEDLQAARIETIEEERDSLADYADELRAELSTVADERPEDLEAEEDWIETIEAESEALDAALNDE